MAFIPYNRKDCSGGTLATIVEARWKLEYDERVLEQSVVVNFMKNTN